MTISEQALINQFKQSLGVLKHLDYADSDTVSAHKRLGWDAREQIWRTLTRRLDELGSIEQVGKQITLARKAQKALEYRLKIKTLDISIYEAVEQYMLSLSAWANGARLESFTHPYLTEKFDGKSASAEDLATLLQEDEVGCQTGSYRERDGSVIVWHTEEDGESTPGERFDKLRIFSFVAKDNQIASGFVYPDLLPGPSFAWQSSNFIQAVDTLHVKFVDDENAILPNALTWISLYLGGQTSSVELARQLGPFRGGYSITSACKKDMIVKVEKVEFANDAVFASQLEESPGCYTLQTNIIRNLKLPIGAQEQTKPENRLFNEKRLASSERFLNVIQNSSEALPLILRMLQSRQGGDAAYANHDVKAYIICHLARKNTRIWVGSGAPMPDDMFFTVETGESNHYD